MKYRQLGSTGLIVSRITLGTMTFGVKEWEVVAQPCRSFHDCL